MAVRRRGAADDRDAARRRGRQREFINRLADHQLAALGFGIGFGHHAVPPAIVEVAAERQFPVFEVSYDVPFIAVTEAAFTQLVNEQYAVLRRALAAQERLERIVLSERGLDALAGALAALIGAAVLVFDPRGELLVQHAFRRPLDEDTLIAVSAQLRERTRRRDARAFMPDQTTAGTASRFPSPPTGRRGRRERASPPANGSPRRGSLRSRMPGRSATLTGSRCTKR